MTDYITIPQNLTSMKESAARPIVLGYRRDIDGLRAIAVLLVIFYHIWGASVPAGFVGVDVFFVISGYLISSHLVAELEAGTFSLQTFYLRRIRRILPAFTVVLAVVAFVGYFILLPEDLLSVAQSMLAATLSVSNVYFWKFINVGYFSTNAAALPLLHTWSLGIEEQFYLVWPLTLFLLFIGLKKFNSLNKGYLLFVTVFLAGTSYFLYYHFRAHEGLVFYLPMTRAFELLSGAGLAIAWNKSQLPSRIVGNLLSIIGLVSIIYTANYLSPADFPSAYSLLPCLGAVLLIYSGKAGDILINQFLSSRWLAFIGLISYSLYLWHWPIIAYVNYLRLEIEPYIGLLILLVSLFFSYLSWKYVEQPFRTKYKFGLGLSVFYFLIVPVILISALSTTKCNSGYKLSYS